MPDNRKVNPSGYKKIFKTGEESSSDESDGINELLTIEGLSDDEATRGLPAGNPLTNIVGEGAVGFIQPGVLQPAVNFQNARDMQFLMEHHQRRMEEEQQQQPQQQQQQQLGAEGIGDDNSMQFMDALALIRNLQPVNEEDVDDSPIQADAAFVQMEEESLFQAVESFVQMAENGTLQLGNEMADVNNGNHESNLEYQLQVWIQVNKAQAEKENVPGPHPQ